MKSARVRAVLGLVSELSDNERDELRAELDGMFLSLPEEWNSAWNDELSNRIAQIERGDVALACGAEIMAELRAELLG